MKTCTKCKIEKELTDFNIDKRGKYGVLSKCKLCCSKYYNDNLDHIKKYRELNKDKLKDFNKEYRKNNKEKLNENRKKYYNINKEKLLKENKEYKTKNKEILKEKRKIYLSNPENHKRKLENNKEWFKNNPNYIINNSKQRYKTDKTFKIKQLLRGRIFDALKKGKVTKNHSSIKLLGCDVEEYKQYLESQFLPEFTWDNHGKIWEIDHKKGLANFDLNKEEEQLKAFNYKNTRPAFKTTKIAQSFGYDDIIGNRNRNKIH